MFLILPDLSELYVSTRDTILSITVTTISVDTQRRNSLNHQQPLSPTIARCSFSPDSNTSSCWRDVSIWSHHESDVITLLCWTWINTDFSRVLGENPHRMPNNVKSNNSCKIWYEIQTKNQTQSWYFNFNSILDTKLGHLSQGKRLDCCTKERYQTHNVKKLLNS